ncbi:SDR family NAD(P)-dependent oxidoreductase [Sphingomonas sp. ID0503]|uniref:SDR family NAD(P)-dependent oxidoreductase n=1 Tax=Sphingomonas sp. ID0503 TaxID=3399691 RepID=UPI003AFB3B57
MRQLEGKSAMITAAASGIGRATAITLAKRGASVMLADIALGAAEAVAAEIRSEGGVAEAIHCDIGEEAQIKAAIDATVSTFGKIDILHNNAALLDPEVFAEDVDITTISTEAWDRTMQVTLRGTMLGCKYAVIEMKKTGGGSIVNTSSMYGVSAFYRQSAYGVAKGAIITLTEYVATSFGRDNIRCNAIAPSMIRTPILAEIIPEALIKLNEDSVLLPFLGEPQDMANVVAFLASEEARYLTGLVIKADGGSTSHLATYADARRFYDGA